MLLRLGLKANIRSLKSKNSGLLVRNILNRSYLFLKSFYLSSVAKNAVITLIIVVSSLCTNLIASLVLLPAVKPYISGV